MNIIKKWRTANSLTQKQAADLLGYKSYVSINYFENGARKIPMRLLKTIQFFEQRGYNEK